MSIATVIITYTIVLILGLVLMFRFLKGKKRPVGLVAFHLLFTLAGFVVFTFYVATEIPMGQFSWPRLSYLLFGAAGTLAIGIALVDKLIGIRGPKWLPVSRGIFEITGYTALWLTLITISG